MSVVKFSFTEGNTKTLSKNEMRQMIENDDVFGDVVYNNVAQFAEEYCPHCQGYGFYMDGDDISEFKMVCECVTDNLYRDN